jgi:hypothetical protein
MRKSMALFMLVAFSCNASADIVTQWNFNSTTPDGNTATGVITPNLGAGTASLISGTTATFASGDANGGSSDPVTGDDSGWNVSTFAAQGEAARGVEFRVSTVGFQDIVVNWDQRFSNTSSRGTQFQYTLDGTNFVNFGALLNATTGDTWINNRSIDLSSITGVNDNANFGVRIMQLATDGTNYQATNTTAAYATTGTWRFDMVTINGVTAVPEPTSLAMLGFLGALAPLHRLRRRGSSASRISCRTA